MMTRKYDLPDFLTDVCSRDHYVRWLDRKADAHKKRDRKRGNPSASQSEYKAAIHRAVLAGGERDAYTGEPLDWSLISTYDNDESKAYRRVYKRQFALMPTVDHVGDGTGSPDFRICAWRTNAAKAELDLGEFVELCRRVVEHHEKEDDR